MSRADLVAQVEKLGPWHYCHIIDHPGGVVSTGSSLIPVESEKLVLMDRAGAFPLAEYPKVLDLGANSGLISMWFTDHKGSEVVAAELGTKFYPQLEFIVNAKGYANKITSWCWDITKGGYGVDTYDLILFLGTMHHIAPAQHSTIFSACYEALKPSGSFVVQTIGVGDRDQLVMKRLRAAGFANRELLNYRQGDRLAWRATKLESS